MEEKKATEVKCPTCDESKQVKNTQRFVLLFGGVFFFFGVYVQWRILGINRG